ncbi:hypothetical protein D1AOALGA4SA_287 [Olavius algarvensis Delta 1 endosymbiont]|nr:hypothetical protein D1AOALGA4SA_287 [Olavius algarvensis Delta 1 endosymbiont]
MLNIPFINIVYSATIHEFTVLKTGFACMSAMKSFRYFYRPVERLT